MFISYHKVKMWPFISIKRKKEEKKLREKLREESWLDIVEFVNIC